MAYDDRIYPLQRIYPMQQPSGWKPKVPRWMLQLPSDVEEVAVAYVGIQTQDHHKETWAAQAMAVEAVQAWLQDDADGDAPVLFEKLEVLSGFDVVGSLVWICYWTSADASRRGLGRLKLDKIFSTVGVAGSSLGLWRESYISDLHRFETNYSGTDYRAGIARLPQSKQVPHDMTGYWGAARDRLPASAYDKFEREDGDDTTPDFEKSSRNAHLIGTNPDTIVHIRSGQFWGNSSPEEVEAYESALEPALRNGLDYLKGNPRESGDFGLRFLRNLPKDGEQTQSQPLRETCGAGFFRNLGDLEKWAKHHPSHHKIYNGAMKHAREFGAKNNYKFRTWHEVSVLKPGEASFDYVNCLPQTGMIPFQDMQSVD